MGNLYIVANQNIIHTNQAGPAANNKLASRGKMQQRYSNYLTQQLVNNNNGRKDQITKN
jgi:hypothetical protein